MKDVMGIVYTGSEDLMLRELTSIRSVAALPVAGRYRMVDFVLSSMVNSGIRNVGVLMQKNYHSLIDHIGSGKEWDLHTRVDGLFILPPFMNAENAGTYTGLLDALHSNMSYLRRSRQEYVVIASGSVLMNANFEEMVQQHLDSGADITVGYTRDTASDLASHGGGRHAFMQFDTEGRLTNMEINPNAPSFDNIGLDLFVVRRKLLIYLVDQAIAQGMHSMYADLIRSHMLAGSLDIRGYEYKGFARRIETVLGYYKLNMDIIRPEVRNALFGENPVFTKTRDDAPAKYMAGSSVKNSFVADGCVIEGTVENSVLFRGVRVEKGAVVKNCVIMQDSDILEGAEVENVIFDKAVTLRRRGRLVGQPLYPIVVGKNTTL